MDFMDFFKTSGEEQIDWSVVPVMVDWNQELRKNNTVITTHVWAAPQYQRGHQMHDKLFGALKNLGASYVRYLTWFPAPRLAVAELKPPTETETFWDFSLLDPMLEDFMKCNEGKPVVANLATIPTWMFKTDEPVPYPEDLEEAAWFYEQGNEPSDPSFEEIVDYFYRLASWYIKGGFEDELGIYHESGHHYKFDYWEVLCEPDFGHQLSPEVYTKLYDEIVERLQELDPDMKFIGLSLSHDADSHEYIRYFLDKKNHKSNVRVDGISYHPYYSADMNSTFMPELNGPYSEWRCALFTSVDGLVKQAKYIETLRDVLNPEAETHVNEIGAVDPAIMNPNVDLPQEFWALSAATFAYFWSGLVDAGVKVASISELFDYPGMFASLTLVDWKTGEPNERYWTAKMLLDNFKPGDSVVFTFSGRPEGNFNRIHAKGFVTTEGQKKLLLVNKWLEPITVALPMEKASISYVDTTTGQKPASSVKVKDGMFELGPYATAVVTFE